jgi:3' exoribonuclease, RNase T-like
VSKFNHVMVKLETASTEYNAGILCIAAVKFNLDSSSESEEFVAYINPVTLSGLGLSIDRQTLSWVRDNRPDVWEFCRESSNDLVSGLGLFGKFIGSTVTDSEMWGNGSDFVFPVLKSSFKAVDMSLPYKFYKSRDLRTVMALSGVNTKDFLDDSSSSLEICRQQVNMLKHIVGKQ